MKKPTNVDPEFVGLDKLDIKTDDSELPIAEVSDAASDAPGDDAILEQEELYEGISSETLPSDKLDKG
jgi:hypothetical protein